MHLHCGDDILMIKLAFVVWLFKYNSECFLRSKSGPKVIKISYPPIKSILLIHTVVLLRLKFSQLVNKT